MVPTGTYQYNNQRHVVFSQKKYLYLKVEDPDVNKSNLKRKNKVFRVMRKLWKKYEYIL